MSNKAIEKGAYDLQIQSVCDPVTPYQKGQIERTNVSLHKLIPKKTDFNEISERQVQYASAKSIPYQENVLTS